MGLDSLCCSYATSAERVLCGGCPALKTLVFCLDLKGPQARKLPHHLFEPSQGKSEQDCLTISSEHVAKVHQIHNSLKILEINWTWWLSFKNVLYIFLKGRDRRTNFHFKPPVRSRGKAKPIFSPILWKHKLSATVISLPLQLMTHTKQTVRVPVQALTTQPVTLKISHIFSTNQQNLSWLLTSSLLFPTTTKKHPAKGGQSGQKS